MAFIQTKCILFYIQFPKFSTLHKTFSLLLKTVEPIEHLDAIVKLLKFSMQKTYAYSWQTYSTFVHACKSWSVTTEDRPDSDGLLQVLQLCLETSLCGFDSCDWGCLSESLRLVCKYLKYANYSLSDAKLALEVAIDRLSPSASMPSHFTWSTLG